MADTEPGATEAAPPVVTCPGCGGVTFRLGPCGCRSHGDAFLVDDTPLAGRGDGEPWRDCELCGGVGTVARRCGTCRGVGGVRAQIVVSVANVDTGAVASAQVTPRSLDPVLQPWGQATADLMSLVGDLAARVGARHVYDRFEHRRPLQEFDLRLGEQWDPAWPAASREAVAAAALAGQVGERWRILLAGDEPRPGIDPDVRLGELCAAATGLCLDLVVERREIRPAGSGRLGWAYDVRLQAPGTPLPADLSLAAVCGRDLESVLARCELRRLLAEFTSSPASAARPGCAHRRTGSPRLWGR